jgi:type II secretory pathway pseudopilin PulG
MRKFKHTFNSCNSKGLTLVEVLASIVLATIAMTLVLVSINKHNRQMHLADQKQHAMDLLESKLAEWFDSGIAFPIDQTGYIPGEPDYFWKTVSKPAFPFGLEQQAIKLKVQIVYPQPSGKSLAQVELLVTQQELPAELNQSTSEE